MRPVQQPNLRLLLDDPEPEEIVISSDSDEMEDDNQDEPEVIVISSDSEPEEPNQEEFDILSDLEDGEIVQVGDILT